MTDDELLALAKKALPIDSENWTPNDLELFRRNSTPSVIIALIERHNAERNGFEMVREQMAATIARHVEEKDALRAEVERLTRERDEAREDTARVRRLAAEDSTAEQQKRVAAESALAAARKRVGALEGALSWYSEEWRYDYDNDCCFDGVSPARRKNGGLIRRPDGSENGVLHDNGDRARAALAAPGGADEPGSAGER